MTPRGPQPPHARSWVGLDRSGWANLPGLDMEPDLVQFVDELTGYVVVLARHPHLGTWSGVVGFPASHPAAALGIDECEEHFAVHGGITWRGEMAVVTGDPPAERPYAFRPDPDDPRPVPPVARCIGFDCSHVGDWMPAMRSLIRDSKYRSLVYVTREALRLAQQLYAMERAALPDPVALDGPANGDVIDPEAMAAIRASLDLGDGP